MEMDQEKLMKLQQEYGKSREIEESLGIVEQQIAELNEFKDNLKEIENNKEKEILASLGKGVFMKSEIKDRKLFVDVGSGTLVRKTAAEAEETVKEQIEKLMTVRAELSRQIETLNEDLQKMMKELEQKK